MDGSSASARLRLSASARLRRTPSADTRRAVHLRTSLLAQLRAPADACCACTHYLVFKEPATAPRLGAFPPSVNDGPAKQLFRTTFRGTLRGYYPRLSLSITFCPKPHRHGVRQKDVHLCCCVEVERPISHCRAGTRQTNSVRIQAGCSDVNRGQSGPGNCHVFPYESRRADRQRPRRTEGGASRRQSGVR